MLILNMRFMRGSMNFRQGGMGPGQSDKKALTMVFFFFFLFIYLFIFSPLLILLKSNG